MGKACLRKRIPKSRERISNWKCFLPLEKCLPVLPNTFPNVSNTSSSGPYSITSQLRFHCYRFLGSAWQFPTKVFSFYWSVRQNRLQTYRPSKPSNKLNVSRYGDDFPHTWCTRGVVSIAPFIHIQPRYRRIKSLSTEETSWNKVRWHMSICLKLASVICWRRAASANGMVFDLFSQRDITNLTVRTLRCKNCIRRPDYGWLYRNGIDASRATGVRRAWRSNGNVVLISSLRHSTCVRPDCARHLSIVSIVWYRVSIRPMDVEPWAVWMKSLWSRHIPSAFRKRRL